MRTTKEQDKIDNIISDRNKRDECVNRYEVLEKVKDLLLISVFESITLKQLADYYEVDPHAIEMICVMRLKILETN